MLNYTLKRLKFHKVNFLHTLTSLKTISQKIILKKHANATKFESGPDIRRLYNYFVIQILKIYMSIVSIKVYHIIYRLSLRLYYYF